MRCKVRSHSPVQLSTIDIFRSPNYIISIWGLKNHAKTNEDIIFLQAADRENPQNIKDIMKLTATRSAVLFKLLAASSSVSIIWDGAISNEKYMGH